MAEEKVVEMGGNDSPNKNMVQPGESVTINVGDLNAKIAEAGDVKQPTAKQIEKAKKDQERHWNTMISRKEASQMVENAINETRQHVQLLYVQVQSMFEALTDKGHVTVDEMEEYSKKVFDKIFGQPPVQENPEQPQPTEEVSANANGDAENSNK